MVPIWSCLGVMRTLNFVQSDLHDAAPCPLSGPWRLKSSIRIVAIRSHPDSSPSRCLSRNQRVVQWWTGLLQQWFLNSAYLCLPQIRMADGVLGLKWIESNGRGCWPLGAPIQGASYSFRSAQAGEGFVSDFRLQTSDIRLQTSGFPE